ncbi:MAG: dienelactone hydrolase family protein [Parachlamydiaceae bacterium]|nr:dienelactone hydrolase family protein [Parachlamydiaceae bacterium]
MTKEESVDYRIDDKNFKGFFAYPEGYSSTSTDFPTVLVFHAWMGQDQFARDKAKALAQMGYIGFAVDLYGDGKCVSTAEEATLLMTPFFENRSLLQKRVKGAFEFISQYKQVDSSRIGAIGFCFGGLAAIELLRSGVNVKAVVSFHALLGNKMGQIEAKTVPIAKSIAGSLLILHGYDDPLVSHEDILNMQQELNQANVDWQMHVYGHTAHAFTNPQAHDSKHGLMYQSKSCKRALESMQGFFKELFKKD